MKYIIMCGGNYKHWETPRHLSIVKGETLVARTIRLLRENGITDIAISTHNPIFEQFGVPLLKHDNLYEAMNSKIEEGNWFNCFYPTEEPACYMFGDVYFSDEAVKTIVETETDDIEFFGSKPPFADNYIKTHEEPFALKVVNQKHLREAIEKTKQLEKEGKFWRKPIMWELWTVIKDTPLQVRPDEYPAEYTVINDYTCDIDWKADIINLERKLGGKFMLKVKAIKDFTLGKFDELKNIERANPANNEKGKLYENDIFECDNSMADYLMGQNPVKEVVVEIIEVIPEERASVELEVTFDTKKAIDKVNDIKDNGGTIEKAKEEVEKIIEETIKVKPKKATKKKTSKK